MERPWRVITPLAIIFGILLILTVPNCNLDKPTPEEKTIQEAAEATMKADLRQAEIGDFLKLKDGRIGPITNLGGDGYFLTTSIGTPAYEYSTTSLSKNVIKIIKQGTPEWEKIAIKYCSPPYY